MMTEYDRYNREERALCAHLFRLLHEGLSSNPQDCYLKHIIDRCVLEAPVRNAWESIRESSDSVRNSGIFCEVALLRDAVHKKSKRLMPTDVKDRAEDPKVNNRVQWSAHGMISAKPDLVIAFPGLLLVFEAKFTMGYGADQQLERTKDLVDAWMNLHIVREDGDKTGIPIWSDLGILEGAQYAVLTLGSKPPEGKKVPGLSWEDIFDVMKKKEFPKDDRTYIAFDTAIEILARMRKS